MDYTNSCRTCLGNEKEMRHINASINISGIDVRLSDILKSFYDFEVIEHEHPDKICINCVHQLTITYSFKILIDSTTKTLSEQVNFVDNHGTYAGFDYDDDELTIANMKNIRFKSTRNKFKKVSMKPELEEMDLFCVECKARFMSIKALTDHCNNHHPVKSSVGRECDYCKEHFEDFRSLVLHRKLHLKPYLCENCWEGFYSENELKTHSCQPNVKLNKEKNNTEGRELRQCDQCGKSYPPGYIRIHMLTHSDNHQYSCKYCPKKFKVPGSLHSHILWNHKRTRNHKCEVCDATFISSSSRSSHIRKNHLKEKKYGCDSCSKRFFSKSELQRHALTHTGVKNFHCHLCDKSYQTRYGLNVHLRCTHILV